MIFPAEPSRALPSLFMNASVGKPPLGGIPDARGPWQSARLPSPFPAVTARRL